MDEIRILEAEWEPDQDCKAQVLIASGRDRFTIRWEPTEKGSYVAVLREVAAYCDACNIRVHRRPMTPEGLSDTEVEEFHRSWLQKNRPKGFCVGCQTLHCGLHCRCRF